MHCVCKREKKEIDQEKKKEIERVKEREREGGDRPRERESDR